MSDEHFMELALAQAREAAACGEVPVGAVVVRNGAVVARGRNAMIGVNDPTAHAEIVATRAAALALGNYRLGECELFVTLEPCVMCSGAILAARFQRVVFGAREPKTGAAGSVIDIYADKQLNHHTVVRGGVLADACGEVVKKFFRERRASQLAMRGESLRDDALRTPDDAFAGLDDYPWQGHYVSDLPSLVGLRLHYLDVQADRAEQGGNARQTYLCVHDSPAWSWVFRGLVVNLSRAGHRVVAPDLIGFGKSDKPKKESFHRFSRHRNILVELVERLELQNIVLVMPAPGSLLALSLPLAAPHRYRGLRLMNACDPVEEVDVSMDAGKRILQAVVERVPESGASTGERRDSLNFSTIDAALNSPFPGKSHRAAIRAFAASDTFFESGSETVHGLGLDDFWGNRYRNATLPFAACESS